MFHRLLKYLLGKIFYFRNKKFINNRKNVVFSSYRGETRSLEYASTGVVNSRYD